MIGLTNVGELSGNPNGFGCQSRQVRADLDPVLIAQRLVVERPNGVAYALELRLCGLLRDGTFLLGYLAAEPELTAQHHALLEATAELATSDYRSTGNLFADR